MNALNVAVQEEIRAAAAEAAERDDVRRSSSTAASGSSPPAPTSRRCRPCRTPTWSSAPARCSRSFSAVAAIPKPAIAAITGYALGGGCELALAATSASSADDAKLGQPEILLGVIPGAGGTQRLSRLVGASRAKEIIFSGRFVDAQEALAIGLADKVVPAADVYAAAREWAPPSSARPVVAVRAAKEAIDRGLEVDLETGLEIERMLFAGLFATRDREIGMPRSSSRARARRSSRAPERAPARRRGIRR